MNSNDTQAVVSDLSAVADPGVGRLHAAVSWVLPIAGLVGGGAAFVLAVEKFLLLSNPFYTPSCTLSARFSCGTVMASAQSEVFGFPNPLIGIAGFAALLAAGAALLAGGGLATWFWAGLQVGVAAGVVFVHWLMFQSIFVIGALCPYCMVVWAAMITAFCAVTACNLAARAQRWPERWRGVATSVASNWTTVTAAWLLAVAALVVVPTWLA